MPNHDWDDFLRRLGPRQVTKMLAKAGGRAAAVCDKSATKSLKKHVPVVTGELRAALKSLRKRERGTMAWRIQWRADLPYWGRVINVNGGRPSQKLIAAYDGAQGTARERWRTEAEIAIARGMKEALR